MVGDLVDDIKVTQPTPGQVRVTAGDSSVTLEQPFENGNPQDQLAQVLNYKWNRQDRLAEIIEQQTDIMSFFALVVPMAPRTHPNFITLLHAMNGAVEKITTQAKHLMSTPRPAHLSGVINPIIQTPAHSSCPSGHATEAAALARALSALVYGVEMRPELNVISDRIAENRVVAGVHFPEDSVQGQALAAFLMPIFLSRLADCPTDDVNNPLGVIYAMAQEELG
jgi:membrane-associated phospholipid phosphatase